MEHLRLTPHQKLVGVCIAVTALVALGSCIGSAHAHPGGMAQDGCRHDRAAGERHWHLEGTSERGGECISRDGATVQVAPPERQIETLEVQLADERAVLDELRAHLADWQAYAEDLEAQGAQLERRLEAARAEARAARTEAELDVASAETRVAAADAVARDAEARARGHGPRVDRRCRGAVEAIVHAETGWMSDAVKIYREGRVAPSNACLDP